MALIAIINDAIWINLIIHGITVYFFSFFLFCFFFSLVESTLSCNESHYILRTTATTVPFFDWLFDCGFEFVDEISQVSEMKRGSSELKLHRSSMTIYSTSLTVLPCYPSWNRDSTAKSNQTSQCKGGNEWFHVCDWMLTREETDELRLNWSGSVILQCGLAPYMRARRHLSGRRDTSKDEWFKAAESFPRALHRSPSADSTNISNTFQIPPFFSYFVWFFFCLVLFHLV